MEVQDGGRRGVVDGGLERRDAGHAVPMVDDATLDGLGFITIMERAWGGESVSGGAM